MSLTTASTWGMSARICSTPSNRVASVIGESITQSGASVAQNPSTSPASIAARQRAVVAAASSIVAM
jgi:hypothetical protein